MIQVESLCGAMKCTANAAAAILPASAIIQAITNVPSDQSSQNHGGYKNDLLQGLLPTIIALAIGLVVAGYAHILANRRDDRKRVRDSKDRFGTFIKETLATLPNRGLKAFYDSTKPGIKIAVHTFQHYPMAHSERSTLDRLWKEYDTIDADELDESFQSEVFRKAFETQIGKPYQHPREIIRYYLEEFYKFSK